MRALDGVSHLRELLRYFAPSLSKLYLAEDIFSDPHANLMQLARAGSASPLEGADRGFFLDGNYFGLLVLSTMPKQTFMGMMQIVTGLAVPNFRVVVNCYPLSVERKFSNRRGTREAGTVDRKQSRPSGKTAGANRDGEKRVKGAPADVESSDSVPGAVCRDRVRPNQRRIALKNGGA